MKKTMEFILGHRNFIPILILTGILINTTVVILTSGYYDNERYISKIFLPQHYIAGVFLALNVFLYFKHRAYFKFGVMSLLVVGTFNGAIFTIYSITSHFALNDIPLIVVQPLSLTFVFVYAILNITSLRKEDNEESNEDMEKNAAIILQNKEESILKYKFQTVSDEELNQNLPICVLPMRPRKRPVVYWKSEICNRFL
jgi:hypothetical protein